MGGQIQEIMNAVNSAFVIDRQAEVTMEVNPGDVSPEYLRNLRDWGVNA
jgi:oxygen-independent coproporphyrinogen-3 oxidase